jgi:hypothetical protein
MARNEDHFDKFVSTVSETIVTFPDGTPLDPEPVRRLIAAGQPVSEEDLKALRKTEERDAGT